jgi:FlaA1/EpsC-like NDP-sugar epimerase
LLLAVLEDSRVIASVSIMAWHLSLLLVCSGFMLMVFGMYASLWRYAEAREYLLLTASSIMSFVLYVLLAAFMPFTPISRLFVLSVAAISLLGMLSVRFVYRQYRQRVLQPKPTKGIRLAIVGAGSAGVTLLEEIMRKPDSNYIPVCFFDDDPLKQQCTVRGLRVVGRIDAIPLVCRTMEIQEIIIAVPTANDSQRRHIIEQCSHTACSVKILPDAVAQIENEYHNMLAAARSVSVEDLLGRSPVKFKDETVCELICGKVVLITGAGGSIGAELCRQMAQFEPARLVMTDIYENNIYDLAQELQLEFGSRLSPISLEIASVRDVKRFEELFTRYRPQVVFHAAAHKHVPLMEQAPTEAVKNNVFGTYNLIQLSERHCVEKFVMLSTDKAVNPTNIMGATKRLCEMMVQSMEHSTNCAFVAVRFGNVLGSHGSVVPLFTRQIAKGGPITLTHRDIIRYFMTIPEAAQLVLQAGAMANQSEIFVLDMGEPIKILTLAENMIRLSGLRPYEDIDIVEVGLRPGEKLYEELLISGTGLAPTAKKKIFVEHLQPPTSEEIQFKLALLHKALDTGEAKEIVAAMQEAVPTYHPAENVATQTA